MKESANILNRLIVRNVPLARESTLVGEIEDNLRAPNNNFKTINYVYVLDAEKKLVGVFSLRELFQLEHSEAIGKHMLQEVLSVGPKTSPSKVAQFALRHGLKAVPVVTVDGVFLGIVPYNAILQILNQEHTKDVLQFAGVTAHEDDSVQEVLHSSSTLTHVRQRLPWLIVGLGGGLLAAMVIGFFEETLAKDLILAAFIPTIVYMAHAVGSQTQMLFVRLLTTKHDLIIKKQLLQESLINCLLGLILGGIVFLVTMFWFSDPFISLIIGVSIFLTVWFTVIVSVLLPWVFFLRGYDPAVSSGPLATVLNDIMSIVIYLTIASIFLNW